MPMKRMYRGTKTRFIKPTNKLLPKFAATLVLSLVMAGAAPRGESTGFADPSARPMSDVLVQTALIEGPSGLLDDEFRMGLHEFRRRRGGMIPFPLGLAPRDVVNVLHDPVRGHDIGPRRNQAVVHLHLRADMVLGMA